MEGEEPEIDLAELYEKHPAEFKAIITSIVSYIVISYVFGWFWDEGTQCGFWGEEVGCQGVVWLTLAYVSIVVVALSPGIWGVFSLATKGFTHVDKSKRDEVAWVAIFGLGGGAIWATLWLYCLPMTWGLLPWGPWETNWWKVFTFFFGLIWLGGGPMLGATVDIFNRFKGFAEIEQQAEEFETNFAEKLRLSSTETSSEKSSFSRMITVDSSVPKSEQVAPQERYIFAPEEMTWAEHNERAIAMGGHLACITSAEENEQVTKISGGKPVWIGGIRKGSGNGPNADHWYWSDARPWSYTNWHPGEPNNSGGGENRVHLGLQAPGTWNDVGEGWRGPAVYQMSETASTESKSPQFTSILGDMDIHEKYKK